MANSDQVEILTTSAKVWNMWRQQHRGVIPDLASANLKHADLTARDLTRANLVEADLYDANLSEAILSQADMSNANLSRAILHKVKASGVHLYEANLRFTDLSQADMNDADLGRADLSRANVRQAILFGADLNRADLFRADLRGVDLHDADLSAASLIETRLDGANLSNCSVYGVSAWGLNLEGANQANLIIKSPEAITITVDNLEVAQFLYMLLHNEKLRAVIDTITSKVVLILGRFTPSRKRVLDGIRDALRNRNYVPVLFDFEAPSNRDTTETVTLLARMARFIIADLTSPSSIPKELEAIIPSLAVPVKPLIEGDDEPFSMFKDFRKYEWVLDTYHYANERELLVSLTEEVIEPAEHKAAHLHSHDHQ